jgi:uncharacterized membrane protein YcaP (DUF421 family)
LREEVERALGIDFGKLLGPGVKLEKVLYPDVGLIEISIRTLIIYVLLVIGIRLFARRALSPLTPFDFVLVLVLANAVQNAMTGGDNSLTGGVVAAGMLLVANAVLNRTLYQWSWFRNLLSGHDVLLVHQGTLLTDNLRKVGIDADELRQIAQEKGFYELSQVGEAIYEANGDIAFFARSQQPSVYSRKSKKHAPGQTQGPRQ